MPAALELLSDAAFKLYLYLCLNADRHTGQMVCQSAELDIPAILKTLKKINYRGLLSLEYEDHPEDPVPYMARCLKNLRQMFAALS